MNGCLTSLTVREMKMEITPRHHFTSYQIGQDKNVGYHKMPASLGETGPAVQWLGGQIF